MKKVIMLLLAFVMVFTFTSCGEEKVENKPNGNTSTVEPSTSSEQTQTENTSSNNEGKNLLTNSYKVPGKNIVVDVPNYQEMEKGFTQLYILHGERYVAVTAHKNASVTSVGEAHDSAFEKFKENIQNYSYVNSLNISNEKTETVNGVEVYRYEGTVSCALDVNDRANAYDAYVIGYSFIMDNVPCTITGSVINQSQDSAQIEEIKSVVEQMIKTLRSER